MLSWKALFDIEEEGEGVELDVLSRDENGRSAVDAAAFVGSERILQKLLQVIEFRELLPRLAKMRDISGRTPLHVACGRKAETNWKECVETMLEYPSAFQINDADNNVTL